MAEDNHTKVTVLRLGHRPSRDKRVSTHLLLAARAFGATDAFYTGIRDESLESSISKIVGDWGGDFQIQYYEGWRKIIKAWEGKIVHLTMYGLPLKSVLKEIKSIRDPLLVVVGGAKVPGEIYQEAHWNVAVTGQPHSEVSALAIFLNEFYSGAYLDHEFEGARLKVVPCTKGKHLKTRR